MSKLTEKEYSNILKYYNKPIPKSKKSLKIITENILANKLCRCIKSLNKNKKLKEQIAIGICTKNIFNKKNITRGKFTCRKKQTIQLKNSKTKKYK